MIDFGHHAPGPPNIPNLTSIAWLDPWRVDMVIPIDEESCDVVISGVFYRALVGAEQLKENVRARMSLFNGTRMP